jgi:hypothetical protein
MTQQDFGAHGGVTDKTQILYEKNERVPDLRYLIGIAALGVDVQYVITGQRSGSCISLEEQALLASFRSLDVKGRAGVFGMIAGMNDPASARPSIVFHGPVAKSVIGNVVYCGESTAQAADNPGPSE